MPPRTVLGLVWLKGNSDYDTIALEFPIYFLTDERSDIDFKSRTVGLIIVRGGGESRRAAGQQMVGLGWVVLL